MKPELPAPLTKIAASREIFIAFNFLGIPAEKFEELRQQAGGIYELHAEVAEFLNGGISSLIKSSNTFLN